MLSEASVLITSRADRYYGKSQPFKTITAETCSTTPFLNRFKTTSALPKFGFDNCRGANVDKSPCVLIGWSYAGALAARQSVITPGVLAAHHASLPSSTSSKIFGSFGLPSSRSCHGTALRV